MTKNNLLNIAWQSPEKVPGLISGEDALMIYNSLPEQARVGLKYDESSKTMIGSTPFAVANLDSFARKYGARTPNLRDLNRREIMRITQGIYFIDSRNLIVRSREDPNLSKNNSLLKTIYELAEQKEGSIKYPFMIEGYSFISNPEDKNGYGLNLVANSDFKVIQDERFDGKYNGKTFSEVDELGIPKFDKNGSRKWHANNKGLFGLCLYWDMDLCSGNNNLDYSEDDGRVIFIKDGWREFEVK